MKRVLSVLALAGIIALAGGCTTVPSDSGFLSNYSELQQGKYLERFLADSANIKKTAKPSIMLGSIDVAKIADTKEVSVKECEAWLVSELEKGGIISAKNINSEIMLNFSSAE
jgi:hypothetical protein